MRENNLPYIKRLRNQVFPVAYERVCTKLEGKEFAVASVQQAFDNAEALVDQLWFLKELRLQHPLTEEIDLNKKERHQFLLSLRGRVNYYLKSPSVEDRNAAKVLDKWLYGYRDDFNHPTIDGQSGVVKSMSLDSKQRPDLSSSISILNLTDTFTQLIIITEEIIKNDEIRSDDKKAGLLKAKILRKEAYKRLTTLWKSIEVAVDLNVEDVATYIDCLESINWTMAKYGSDLKGKATRLQTAAEKKAEEEKQNALPKNGAQSNSTQSTGMQNRSAFSFVPTNETEEHDDLPNQLAAMQSKTIEGGAVSTIPVNGDQEHDTAEKPEMPIAKQDASTNGSDRES